MHQGIYDGVDTYKCDVFNISLGYENYSQTLEAACTYAKNKNVIIVAAVGNNKDSRMLYPAGFSSVIGVGATTINGVRADFSNYNSSVDVVAPGSAIRVAGNKYTSEYNSYNGTSFAAPHVSALAVIAKGQNKNMTFSAFKTLLTRSVVDKGVVGYDTQYGYGLIDCGRFVYQLTGKDFFAFDDVTKTHWAYDSVVYDVRYGMMAGTAQNTFFPNANITRADFAVTLGQMYEMSGGSISNSAAAGFTDTVYNAYYCKYVKWCAQNGLMSGYGDGRFGPKDPLTREQMAVVLYQYATNIKGWKGTINLSVLNAYTDKSQISAYAQTAMAWCVQNNIISGTTTTTLSPKSNANRAAVASTFQLYSTKYSPMK